jgi:hypothetical protein
MSRAETIRAAGIRILAIAALAVGVLGQAHAALIVGRWDPAFGAPYSNLGWRGSLTADIPDSCAGFSLRGTNLLLPLNCPSMNVLAADVEFYNTGNTGVTLETVNFEPTTELFAVIRDADNNVLGWTTYFTGSQQSESKIAQIDGSNPYFGLQLVYNLRTQQTDAYLWWTLNDPDACIQRNLGSYIVANLSPQYCFGGNGNPGRGGRSNPDNSPTLRAVVTFQEVPEPGSLALAGAALVLLALALRPHRRPAH